VWKLSPEERQLAIAEGKRRQKVNAGQGKTGRNKGPEHGDEALRVHILGAGGEMAVASFLGLKQFVFEETDAKRGSYDLPPDIDVKTRARHHYDLICFVDEAPEKTLVLVTIQSKEIRLHGWIKAVDAKRSEWLRTYVQGRTAYFVPKEALRPIQELKQCCAVLTSPNTPSS